VFFFVLERIRGSDQVPPPRFFLLVDAYQVGCWPCQRAAGLSSIRVFFCEPFLTAHKFLVHSQGRDQGYERLPQVAADADGVEVDLGPSCTGLGWVN
jgi:hypothetical protein